MPEQSLTTSFKRNIAYKLKIGMLLAGKPMMEGEHLKALDLGDKQVVRANVIANIIDKYVQEGERRFGSLTLDDATGQLKVKVFGDDVDRFTPFSQGDTVAVVGLVRSWSNELYLAPDIIRKKDPAFLLLRKLEIEAALPKTLAHTERLALKDKIIEQLKAAEKDNGLDIERLILELKEHPDIINQEVKHLIENGIAYEPRPGRLRWLG